MTNYELKYSKEYIMAKEIIDKNPIKAYKIGEEFYDRCFELAKNHNGNGLMIQAILLQIMYDAANETISQLGVQYDKLRKDKEYECRGNGKTN